MTKERRYNIIVVIIRQTPERIKAIMEKKEDTSRRISRRKYEMRNAEERKERTAMFATKMPRERVEEINAFLDRHKGQRVTKVMLIYAGYEALKELYEPKDKPKQE